MPRYFLEISYKGTRYAGSQVQANAITVQAEIEKVMEIFFRKQIILTGSSRTDTGVHARQSYFHFDVEENISTKAKYNLNSLLPVDIAIHNILPVKPEAHCRFDALAREYEYFIYQAKDPFLEDRAYFFPYTLEEERLKEAAGIIMEYTDFTSFSKRNTQAKTANCRIMTSEWEWQGKCLVYRVKANRFLRGMVRGLVGTMLQVGRGKTTIEEFRKIIETKDCGLANFSVPGHGLILKKVEYPDDFFL
jgi:tRNA pseudouridine38-40 synthase